MLEICGNFKTLFVSGRVPLNISRLRDSLERIVLKGDGAVEAVLGNLSNKMEKLKILDVVRMSMSEYPAVGKFVRKLLVHAKTFDFIEINEDFAVEDVKLS
jgi:hypothetical protein